MLNAQQVKAIVTDLGADLCGIAPADRFEGAPEGFHPRDVFPDCESVLVFARRLPSGALYASSSVPYTFTNGVLWNEIDRIGFLASLRYEEAGIKAVGIPSDDPSEYWEAYRQHAMGIISLRHAGMLAGLGVLGRNTLLKNRRLGNMILLGALLLDAELDGDAVESREACPEDCRICLDACPVGALDGKTVVQRLCRPLSNHVTERGFTLFKCFECRKACPEALGER